MTHKIKVQMFGNFRMDYNGAPFVAEKMHKESQFNRMMQALIHYSDCGIAKDKLEEIVIGERDIDAPHTALRVIVYKTKQKLAQLGLPGKNLIYLEGGIYYWTPDIEIEEDAAEFEKLYNEACALEKQMPQEPESAETVCDERIKEIEDNMLELYVKALYLYKGEFLVAYTGETWIAQEARRYHTMFEKIINEAAYILRKRKQFKGLEKIGVYAAKVDPFNEWEELIMEAMVETRRYDEAEELYTDVVDYYLRECGIYPSSRLLEILEKYSNQMNHAHEILENIQEGMNEQEETERGGYFCSYPVFKGIYQASIRIMKRTRVPVYLMAGTASLAHRRVLKVAQSIGCHEMGLSFYHLKPDYAKEIDKRLDGIIAPLNYGDIVIFQYPSWIGVNYDESFVNKIKSYRDTKLIIFVQDIQKLMFDSEQAILDMEIRTLNKADLLILPSKKMHRYLKENGLDEKPVIYQTIWDMPSDICFVDHAVTRCFHFAGNYNRFPFLAEYHGKTPIYQYDANKPDRENDDSFCWRGYLEQEKLMHELSKGGFGLVWSDDEYFDRYYSMNQPYKLGTNLAAGIPVIVEDDSTFYRIGAQVLYTKADLVGYMVKRLNLTADDVVIIDRTTGIGQAILENCGPARVGIVVHADHFSEGGTDDDYILWNNYYEYSFSQTEHIDFYITATDAQNELMRQQFKKYCGKEPQVVTIPVGSLDELKYPDEPRKRHSLITASRLATEKHCDWLVEAVVKAKESVPDISLDIYGKGGDEAKLKGLIGRLDCADYVHLMGQQKLDDVYKHYDAYVAASQSEGFGLTLMEAIGSGLPIVGFDVRYGNQTFIDDGQNGYKIPITDEMDQKEKIKLLSERIVRMFTEDDMDAFSGHSYEKAKEYLTKEVVHRWIELLK